MVEIVTVLTVNSVGDSKSEARALGSSLARSVKFFDCTITKSTSWFPGFDFK